MRRPKLAYIVSHPIQYQAPLFRYINEHSNIDLTVLYQSDVSLKPYFDAQMGTQVQWDVDLLGGYKHQFLPMVGSNAVTNLGPINYGIHAALSEGGYDALWTHGYAHPVTWRGLAAARRLGMKTMVRIESTDEVAVRRPLTSNVKESMLRWLFQRTDAFLSIGSLNRDYFMKRGVPPEKIFMVPYAVDNRFFQEKVAEARERREELRNELGLQPGRPVILYASKFTKRKRAIDLLEAYIGLSAHGEEPQPYLVMAGNGEEFPAVEARARQTGWSSIKLVGFKNQTELPGLFDLCDVFVLVSDAEPWGLIFNEIMNAGKAVIGSDEVGCRVDLIHDGENGFVVKVGDVAALTDRLRRITSDPGLAAKMGKKSLDIINNWGYREDLLGLEQALDHVLSAHRV
jgi:glycosyltransferase involved in cell wall biosynthesis